MKLLKNTDLNGEKSQHVSQQSHINKSQDVLNIKDNFTENGVLKQSYVTLFLHSKQVPGQNRKIRDLKKPLNCITEIGSR